MGGAPGFYFTQGVLGVTVVVLACVVVALFRLYLTAQAACEARVEAVQEKCQTQTAAKDAELRALHEKMSTEIVPVLTRLLDRLERRQ